MNKQIAAASILLISVIYNAPATAEFYKWTDEHGQVHYGDKPVNNNQAERIEARDNSLTMPKRNTDDASATNHSNLTSSNGTKSNTPTPASVEEVMNARARMHTESRNDMNQKIQQGRIDHKKEMEKEKERNKKIAEFSENLRKKQLENDNEKASVYLDASQRRNGTEILCQRNPQHPKCGWLRKSNPLSQQTEEDKKKIDEINKEHFKEVKKDFKDYPKR